MGEKMMDFSISVIIPAYNSEKTIIRALESVKNQSFIDYILEVIVINDGSTDSTRDLVNLYKEKHKDFPILLINKRNGGVSSARNAGLKKARGKWIALLDADDEWYPEKLQLQFEVINGNKDIDFIGGNHTDQVIKILGKPINKVYKPSVKDLCIKMFPQTSTVLFKKKIYDEIGGYDEAKIYCEDGDFFLKICERYNYYYMPNQVIVFDGGRRGFGVRGLSGDLKGMQKGFMKNIKELRKRRSISLPFYLWVSAFSILKYIRRIIICKLGDR
ncbi:glycosyltransferase family A protein [Lachnospiraceae bacterium 62-26]